MFRPLILIRSQRWAWAAFFVKPAEPGLRGDVRRQERLAAVGVNGDDVDDGARFAPLPHVGDRCLHQEERSAQVHRDVLVEQLRGGVQHGAPGGQPGRVDQAVDPAVPLDGRRDGGLAWTRRRCRPDEDGFSAGVLKLGRHLLAVFGVAAGEHQGGALPGGGPGDPGAEALGAAGDQQHLACQEVLHVDSRAVLVRCAAAPNRGWPPRPGRGRCSTSRTPCAASMKVAALARGHPHQVRGEHDVGMVEQRVVLRGLGVEDVEPHPAEPAVLQRRVDRVEVGESAAAAVDQDRPGLDAREQLGPRPGDGWTPAAGGAG